MSQKDFHEFTDKDALWIVRSPGEDDRDVLDFYVNVDNKFLRSEQKRTAKTHDPRLMETRFVYANVLVGMAMLNGDSNEKNKDGDAEENGVSETVEKRIGDVTAVLAPILIPMVDVLATISVENVIAAT
jgi:hypothetical protein